MDVTEITPELSDHQAEFLETENHCCLCGTALDFDHEVDHLSATVREKAHCETCGVPQKDSEHNLH